MSDADMVFFSPFPWSKYASDHEHRHDGFDVLSETTVHADSESDSTDESSFKPGSAQDSSSESEVDIDCQTTVPADVFARFLQAGKKAKRRGQHQLHWRSGHLVCQEDQCIDLQTSVPTDVFLSFLHAGEEARRRGQHQQQMEGSSRHLVRVGTTFLETSPKPDTGLEGCINQEHMDIDCSTCNSSSRSKVAQWPSHPRLLERETVGQTLHMGIDCSTRNSSSRSKVAQCPSNSRLLPRNTVGQVLFNDESDQPSTTRWSHGCDERLLFLLSMVRGTDLQHKPQVTSESSHAVDLV
eukprot:TRINITY_DN103703_c0_g1_i1.p1 TRINITY_DN103703_c0_g1~~TRINITY_DN103703_c0_g1_i1.p1  ORF type:complete len:296 (+),score=36.98 TRINITY_DN103703_c0_g1_i1:122-1009(+)